MTLDVGLRGGTLDVNERFGPTITSAIRIEPVFDSTVMPFTERCGVYAIVNRGNDKVYIGSTTNLSKRLSRHRLSLVEGRHPNPHLQAAWNRYGEEAFDFVGVAYCDPDDRITLEQEWIDRLGCCDRRRGYNRAPIAGVSPGSAGRQWTAEQRAELSRTMRQALASRPPRPTAKGTDFPGAKLDDKKVRAILLAYGSTTGPRQPHARTSGRVRLGDLAKQYGVSVPTLSAIVNRKAWTHVPDPRTEEVMPV